MTWLHPEYGWALLAVPVVVALFLWAAWQRRKAFAQLGDGRLMARLAEAVSTRRRRWKAALLVLGVGLIAFALVGPRYGTQLREATREGIDLVVALDVSQSMQAEDVAPNRLLRAKNEIKKLLEDLRGDRVGLILFAGDAFIQCPLTSDYGAVRLFLDVADPSLIPTPGTDFGAALRMASQAFEAPAPDAEDDRTRALLFVSDGENHIDAIDQIAEEAQEQGILLFAAGIGETEGAPIPITRNGRQVGFKKDRDGRTVTTKLEEAALQELATKGNGAYFRVARTSSSLSKLTAALERLDRTEYARDEFEQYEEQFQWPLALGLLLLFLERLLSDRRRTVRRAGALWTPETPAA